MLNVGLPDDTPPKLLDAALLADVRQEISAMVASGERGDFEQETRGGPTIDGWPFQ